MMCWELINNDLEKHDTYNMNYKCLNLFLDIADKHNPVKRRQFRMQLHNQGFEERNNEKD